MLDGWIDTQGFVKDLRAQGALDDITHDASVQVHKEEQEIQEQVASTAVDPPSEAVPQEQAKKPRKLIEEEKREEGGVKWHIYKTYLKAS
jgi:carbamoylphosphate synthase small subunit